MCANESGNECDNAIWDEFYYEFGMNFIFDNESWNRIRVEMNMIMKVEIKVEINMILTW